MSESLQIAHLRELRHSGQCELLFFLKVELDNVGIYEEEVRAVRQLTDNVESLLHHIICKLKRSFKLFKDSKSISHGDNDIEIMISLTDADSHKAINPKRVLKNLLTSTKNLEFTVCQRKYVVAINAPYVIDLKLPVVIYANYQVRPSKLLTCFSESSKCKISWHRSIDKENWTEVGKGYKYSVVDDDVGHYLKLIYIPCNSTMTGPASEIVSESRVIEMNSLPYCPFEERHKFTSRKLESSDFRVVSYNVLSNRYAATNEQFPYCPPEALAPDYRKRLIVKELSGYAADIICLQEVDFLLFTSYYKDLLKSKGYLGFFHRKGNRSSEGLTCFFDKLRFKKLDDRQIIYSEEIGRNKLYAPFWNLVKANPELKQCFMKQMTSLQITVLAPKFGQKNSVLIVANTHLFYHPDAGLIRVLQTAVALTYLEVLRKHYQNGQNHVSVILCGDFNCVPTSAVFEFVTNGRLTRENTIFENVKNSFNMSHGFNFYSACGTPKYTNYTSDFKDCLDYIFVETDKTKVKNIAPFPTEEELGKYEGLPNEVYPSDHLALVVDLQLLS